jgi:NDP-sugar pyrophosphorylase family protein
LHNLNQKLFPVIVIAGGIATRLRPVTETIPKAMVPIHDEPFVAHQLRLLKKRGIDTVVMSLGYLGEQIVEYVGDGSRYGLNVQYVFDGPKLLGTAGAVKRALPLVDENFFVLNGDSLLPCDYAAVQQTFIQSQQWGLMTVFHNEGKWDTSNVEFTEGKILAYDKQNRTPRMRYIDYGLEVFSKAAFASVPDNEAYDLVPVYQELLKYNQLAAHQVKERFYENGSFAGIADLEIYLSRAHLNVI